ncbi:MAG: hypothetical protein O3C30_04495, partial [Proteobacteria bacterium]|nr:hypothetical protein [Pseudomonadota bacterium]
NFNVIKVTKSIGYPTIKICNRRPFQTQRVSAVRIDRLAGGLSRHALAASIGESKQSRPATFTTM